jgi:hypothetical protein
MSMPLPETAKQAVEQLTGPRYRPGAYPLLAIAKEAIHGHAAIAEKVREHAALVAAEMAAQRAGRGAEKAAGDGQPPGSA